MAVKKGRTGYLAISPTGVAADDFTEITLVQDVDIQLTKDAADATNRGSEGWKQEVAVLKNCQVNATVIWDPENAELQELKDRWLDDELVGVRAFDASDGQGVEADMAVHEITMNQPIAGIQTMNIVLKPMPSATAPTWFTPA